MGKHREKAYHRIRDKAYEFTKTEIIRIANEENICLSVGMMHCAYRFLGREPMRMTTTSLMMTNVSTTSREVGDRNSIQ